MFLELRSMIDHASPIVTDEFGRPSLLDAKEKALIIMVKEIMKLSNRRMAYVLPLLGITREISYKTVEWLYSAPIVIMILNNIFIESLRRKEMAKCDVVGDGTGYSLTVTKHYSSVKENQGESVRKGSSSIHSPSWISAHACTSAMPFLSDRRRTPTGRHLK